MWPFPNPLDLFGDAVGGVVGWAWDKVIQGIYTWFANGLLLLMEWVWNVLDTATTPRVTEAWFTNGLIRPLAGVAVGITVAMMLASAIQAGLGGRPELIIDALKEGPKSLVATALTVVVMDVMIQGGDVLADVAWQAGRGDAQQVLDGLAATMGSSGGLAGTFLGPLALLFGMIGLLVTTVVLFMRSSMLYLVAAFAPIVWSTSVAPMMRGSGRRLIHLVVALVLAKPAIAITLVVGTKLLANAGAPGTTGASSGASALGTMLAGFSCFAIAGLSPAVIFKLLPSVEGGSAGYGRCRWLGPVGDDRGADGSDGQVDGSLGGCFRSDPGDAVDFERWRHVGPERRRDRRRPGRIDRCDGIFFGGRDTPSDHLRACIEWANSRATGRVA